MRRFTVLCAGLASMLLAGCGESNVEVPLQEVSETRVVTLAPALTQMIVDLERPEVLVGVAQNDAAAPKGLPIVGEYQDIDTESLLSVKPTHVLTMTTTAEPPPALRELAERHKFTVVAYPYPKTIPDVFQILVNEGGDASNTTPGVASLLGTFQESRALRLKYTNLTRLAEISRVTSATGRTVSVLLVIGTNPLMASGQGTVHNDLLGFAGGLNVVNNPDASAPTLDREMLLAARPEVVLLLLPEAPPLKSIDEDERLASFRGLEIPAVVNNRIVLINDPLVALPSTSIVNIGAQMAKAIHPELADEIDRIMSSDPLAEVRASSEDAAADPDAFEPTPDSPILVDQP